MLDAHDPRRAVLQRGEAEPSVVTGEIENACARDKVPIGVNQREIPGVESIRPPTRLSCLDESRKCSEEVLRIEPPVGQYRRPQRAIQAIRPPGTSPPNSKVPHC